MKKVAISGPRDLWVTDGDIAYAISMSDYQPDQLLTGDAKGVDTCVQRYSKRYLGKDAEVYKADWNKYGKKGGPVRNFVMMRDADALIAFVRNGDVVTSGTASAIAQAVDKGIPVFIARVRGA